MKIKKVSTLSELEEQAIRLLAPRSRSVHELRVALEKRCNEPAWIDATIDKLLAQNYLDDVKYALQFARSRTRTRKLGRFRLEQELRARGVANAIIRKAIEETFDESINESALLESALARKLKRASPPLTRKAAKKIYDSLLRAGFPRSAVIQALKKLKVALPSEEGWEGAEE